MTGGQMVGGYATGLPVQIPMIDIQEVGTGGGSIARVEAGALARRPGKRRARAGAGLLRPRRHRADRHRLQSGARPAGADRFLGGEMKLDLDGAHNGDRREDRRAARSRDAGGCRRHPAHRHHQDVACGALGDDRARPRCRRFRAGRLWRRGAAARRAGRARIAHRQGHHSRSRPGISRPTACCSPICAAISSTPGSRRSPTPRSRRWRRCTPRWKSAARTIWRAAAHDRRYRDAARRRHALCRPGARRHRRYADGAVRRRRTATASSSGSMPCTRRATAIPAPTRRPRSSACARPPSA